MLAAFQRPSLALMSEQNGKQPLELQGLRLARDGRR